MPPRRCWNVCNIHSCLVDLRPTCTHAYRACVHIAYLQTLIHVPISVFTHTLETKHKSLLPPQKSTSSVQTSLGCRLCVCVCIAVSCVSACKSCISRHHLGATPLWMGALHFFSCFLPFMPHVSTPACPHVLARAQLSDKLRLLAPRQLHPV